MFTDLLTRCILFPSRRNRRLRLLSLLKGADYTFTCFPMGYLNGPATTHNLCHQDLSTLQLERCRFWHYTDDIMLSGSSEEAVRADLHPFAHHLDLKSQGPASSVLFLGVT